MWSHGQSIKLMAGGIKEARKAENGGTNGEKRKVKPCGENMENKLDQTPDQLGPCWKRLLIHKPLASSI